MRKHRTRHDGRWFRNISFIIHVIWDLFVIIGCIIYWTCGGA